jgi:hypothetical protein
VKSINRILLTVLLALAAIYGGCMGVFAEPTTTTNLPAGILVGDQDGLNADEHGYYYIDCRGLVAGQVIHKTITLANYSQNDTTREGKIPYVLSMTAEPVSTEGPNDLLDTQVVMKLDGKVIYQGSVRGDGTPDMRVNALALGTYEVGDRRTLDITMTVDENLILSEETSKADFRWKFYAYRALTDTEEPPYTGIIEQYWYYVVPFLPVLVLAIILVLSKRKKQKDEPAL